MAEIKMVSCCTCGYEWQQGRDGSHQCSEHMAKTIERLRDALAKARDGLSCGLWDYGPGQSEHDQCDQLLGEIDAVLGDGE